MNVPAQITASVLLEQVLAGLRESAPFLVLRNYEALPGDWVNDVDILVASADLERAHASVVANMNGHAGSASVETMRRINFRAARLACADRELHVDIYSAMSKAWVTYADTTVILAARRPTHALFDTPAPLHEVLLLAAKELFSYGRIRGRYHGLLTGQDPEETQVAAREIFGGYLTEAGQVLVASALANPGIEGRPRLKASAILKPRLALRWALQRHNGWTAFPADRAVSS